MPTPAAHYRRRNGRRLHFLPVAMWLALSCSGDGTAPEQPSETAPKQVVTVQTAASVAAGPSLSVVTFTGSTPLVGGHAASSLLVDRVQPVAVTDGSKRLYAAALVHARTGLATVTVDARSTAVAVLVFGAKAYATDPSKFASRVAIIQSLPCLTELAEALDRAGADLPLHDKLRDTAVQNAMSSCTALASELVHAGVDGALPLSPGVTLTNRFDATGAATTTLRNDGGRIVRVRRVDLETLRSTSMGDFEGLPPVGISSLLGDHGGRRGVMTMFGAVESALGVGFCIIGPGSKASPEPCPDGGPYRPDAWDMDKRTFWEYVTKPTLQAMPLFGTAWDAVDFYEANKTRLDSYFESCDLNNIDGCRSAVANLLRDLSNDPRAWGIAVKVTNEIVEGGLVILDLVFLPANATWIGYHKYNSAELVVHQIKHPTNAVYDVAATGLPVGSEFLVFLRQPNLMTFYRDLWQFLFRPELTTLCRTLLRRRGASASPSA
jgi:hypothetical protein